MTLADLLAPPTDQTDHFSTEFRVPHATIVEAQNWGIGPDGQIELVGRTMSGSNAQIGTNELDCRHLSTL